MGTRWTKADDATLVRLYGDGKGRRTIAVTLARSEDAVDARRRSLGIPARSARRPWSVLEDELIRAATAASISAPELAPRLHRPLEALRRRRRVLGLGRPPARRYSAADDEALRHAWEAGADLDALTERLGRSRDGLRLHARSLGLGVPPRRCRWLPEEDRLLHDGYSAGLSCVAIVSLLLPGRSPGAVVARARKLGLATYARAWSAEEDLRLARLAAARVPLEKAAQMLARTPEALRRRARKLGIEALLPVPHRRARRRWSVEEDAVLRRRPALDPGLLAQLLARSDEAVRRRLVALGLRHGRERSPHHTVQASAKLTPGEQRLLGRELRNGDPRQLLTLSRRLGRSPGELRRLADGLGRDDRSFGHEAHPEER